MARPSYLSRRDGGRYYLQIRLGKLAAELYGREIMRASLKTADFGEARVRLMDSLGWVQELVAAPDLAALGTVLHRRLRSYTAFGAPQSERRLADRVAFEHQVRHYMVRANERGYPFSQQFEGFASAWVDFVDQNKSAEAELARLGRLQSYERGRADLTTAIAQGWVAAPATSPLPPVPSPPPAASETLPDTVHRTIDTILRSALSAHFGAFGAPAAALPITTLAAAQPPGPGIKMSAALAQYLVPPGNKLKHKAKGRADTAGIVRFAIAFLDDPFMNDVTKDDWGRLDAAMTDIPLTKNIPNSQRSLINRYRYAQKHGWEKLSRVTVTTLKGRYRYGLDKFIDWAIEEKLYSAEKPKFECKDDNNTAPLPRDAFDDHELLELISLALFTGCAGINRAWVKGKYFVQNHIYWGFLILILTGMRPGEVGQLLCADLMTDGENFFFDLRSFDARKGRVAMKDLRNLKTNAAGRVVPIHPLLIELGLLDRLAELLALGEKRLFPEWLPYTRRDGTVRWSQPITKSWQYLKKVLKTRADLTLYSTRHLMADWLDAAGIAQRTRDRILGHASAVPGRYGRKGMFSAEQIAAIEAIEPPVVKKMRTILMAAKEAADHKELIVLKPWLSASGTKE